MTERADAANSINRWFRECHRLTQSLAEIISDADTPHLVLAQRYGADLDLASDDDATATLQNLSLFIPSIAEHLDKTPGPQNWKSAIDNVLKLERELGATAALNPLAPGDTAISLLRRLLAQQLQLSGITGGMTHLSEKNKAVALINVLVFATRYLVAMILGPVGGQTFENENLQNLHQALRRCRDAET